MGNFLNENTLEYQGSGNEPLFLWPPWIQNPDMSQVQGVDPKYWKLENPLGTPTNRPIEMDQAEKDAVDAAEDTARVTNNRAETIAELTDTITHLGFRVRELIELTNKRDNFNTNRIAELQQALDAMKAT